MEVSCPPPELGSDGRTGEKEFSARGELWKCPRLEASLLTLYGPRNVPCDLCTSMLMTKALPEATPWKAERAFREHRRTPVGTCPKSLLPFFILFLAID